MLRAIKLTLLGLPLILPGGTVRAAPPAQGPHLNKDVRKPPVDREGRFWVYRDGTAGMVFIPYAWMPAEASKMMVVDLDSTQNPLPAGTSEPSSTASGQPAREKEEKRCVAVKVTWAAPYWCGAAFISGPDAPPWWGEEDRGWYYDLRELKEKKLIFSARGETGQERIQVKVGILGDKPHGDSLRFPVETKWLRLSPQWTTYELDLSKFKPEDLEHICNGFTFTLSQGQQEAPNTTVTQFYLDNIYFK